MANDKTHNKRWAFKAEQINDVGTVNMAKISKRIGLTKKREADSGKWRIWCGTAVRPENNVDVDDLVDSIKGLVFGCKIRVLRISELFDEDFLCIGLEVIIAWV